MRFILFFSGFFLFTVIISPQSEEKDTEMKSAFFTDLVKEIDAAEEKIIALAEAVPQDKYSWKPAENVRSVSEVFMHVAQGNYFLLSLAGAKMPDNMSRDYDKSETEKSAVVENVKKSYEYVDNFLSQLSDSDLEKPLEFFGMKTTLRHLLFILMSHNHEHLGQSIAYARINDISPPWSEGN